MILRDAGVAEYEDEDFSVKFPAPAPVTAVVETVIARDRGITGDAPGTRSNYDKLFNGNKPKLGTPAVE